MTTLTNELRTQVVELYVATFGRSPDAAGLTYWTNKIVNDNWTVAQIAKSFFDQTETQTKFPTSQTTATFIDAVYSNTLGHAADTAGKAYWQTQLDTGKIIRSDFITAIINGAKAPTGSVTDKDYLTNKTTVAEYFAVTLGLNDTAKAATVLNGVTADVATVTTGKAAADAVGVAGKSFSLTTATEATSLTAGNDTVDGATVVDSISGDTIIDSSSTDADVLNAKITSNPAAATTIANVETINVDFRSFGLTFDADRVSNGTVVATSTQAGVTGATVTKVNGAVGTKVTAGTQIKSLFLSDVQKGAVINAGSATTIGINALDTTAADDTATVILTGNASAVTINDKDLTGASGTKELEVLTLQSSTGANQVTLATSVLETTGGIVVTGDKDLTITAAVADVAKDALAAGITKTGTGALTLKLSATSDNKDLTKIAASTIDVATATAGHALTVSDATNVKLSQANAIDLVSSSTTSTTDTVTVTLNNATTAFNNGSAGNGTGADVFNTINVVSSLASTLTMAAGANGAVVISGDKALTLANTSTAKSVVATNLTAALTATTTANLTKVTGGSGDDTIIVSAAVAETVDGGAGTDTLQLLSTGGSIDFAAAAKNISLSNVEILDIQDVDLKVFGQDLSGKSMIVTDSVAGTTGTLTVDASATVTVDLSNFTVDTNNVGTITIGSTSAIASTLKGTNHTDSITGGTGADYISGGAGADTLEGGAGADTIVAGNGIDRIVGGDAADAIDLAETTAAADTVAYTAASEYGDSVTGFAAGTGADVIELDKALANSANTTFTTAAASISGTVITKAAVTTATQEGALISATVNAGATNKVAAADFADLTKVANLLTDTVTVTDGVSGGAEKVIFVVEASDSSSASAAFAVYSWTQGANTDTTIGNTELTLVGTFTGTGTVTMADFTLV